jgi:hypothetical protein
MAATTNTAWTAARTIPAASPADVLTVKNVLTDRRACRHNLYMQSTGVPSHFTKDMERLTEALLPYVRTLSDGFQVIDGSAPADLVRPYRSLVSMGYAKGWL